MGADSHWQLGHTQGAALDLPQPFKQVGAYRHAGHSSSLQLYRVVDTPRRAGASIRQADDHGVGRSHQFIQNVVPRRYRSGEFFSVDGRLDFVLLA